MSRAWQSSRKRAAIVSIRVYVPYSAGRQAGRCIMESLVKAGLAVDYNKRSETKPDSLPSKVYIWDETLRDGEQTPGVALTLDEKIEIAKTLDDIGAAIVVVGFPAVSEAEKRAVAAVAREGLRRASIGAPARAVISDIDACIDAGVKEVILPRDNLKEAQNLSPYILQNVVLSPVERIEEVLQKALIEHPK